MMSGTTGVQVGEGEFSPTGVVRTAIDVIHAIDAEMMAYRSPEQRRSHHWPACQGGQCFCEVIESELKFGAEHYPGCTLSPCCCEAIKAGLQKAAYKYEPDLKKAAEDEALKRPKGGHFPDCPIDPRVS